jgi:DNA-directed RNA polymerase specialized sigma24 family protein
MPWEDHVLRTDLTDHRGTDDARLLSALADGDAIALAEAYHRTVTAAHACARRMLASPVEIEALMRAVYGDLWEEPPVDAALEGWVRARCFTLGAGYLRQRSLRAPSPSLATFTSGVEAEPHAVSESLEQIISELTEQQRQALVRAHDQGIPTAQQDDPDAGWSLLHALLVLASPLTDDERHAAEMCSSGVALANWTFGLLLPHEASTVPGTAAEPTPCGRLAGVLRRARRRFEPLPPTPDLGHRVLASVLTNGTPRQPSQKRGSDLDSDLRVAYADVGPSQSPASDEPTSSLDMTIPSPLPPPRGESRQGGSPTENGRRPVRSGWDTEDDLPTPLRPAGPPAHASSGPLPPAPQGIAAPALASPDLDEPASDDLVRMPLRRPAARPSSLGPAADTALNGPAPAPSPLPPGDPTILRPGTPDDDATIPPSGLRGRHDDARHDDARRGSPPRGLRGFDSDEGPVASPLSAEEQRGSRTDRDPAADSPLRRPAPKAREFDSQPSRPASPPPPRGLDTRRPQGLDTGPRPPQRDDSGRPPVRRSDRDPLSEPFFGDEDATMPPPSSGAPAATTAAMPAVRRRETPPGSNRMQPPSGPTPTPSPAVEVESSGGGGILRWAIVIVLVALGAAFGIWLGQQMIG